MTPNKYVYLSGVKKQEFNPFSISKYIGPENFCDRDTEVSSLINAAENQRSLMLTSMRRLGKTGLLHHLHHKLGERKWLTAYVDAFDTDSDEDLANRIISKVLLAIDSDRNKFVDNALTIFYGLSPKFSTDYLTGMPTIELGYRKPEEVSSSIESVFQVLDTQKKTLQIAIDEFQQIAKYRETSRMDAILRKLIQQTRNAHFIFSGSQRHVLSDLFVNPKKPMHSMVQYMNLEKIPYPHYFDFIKEKFELASISISEQVIHLILEWTRTHTYYTQFVCNRLYSMGRNKVEEKELDLIKQEIFAETEFQYLNYLNILSRNQMKLLKAIAMEGEITSVRSAKFLNKYGMPGSSAKQSLDYLIETELVYEELSHEKNTYIVYDVFLWRYMEYLGNR